MDQRKLDAPQTKPVGTNPTNWKDAFFGTALPGRTQKPCQVHRTISRDTPNKRKTTKPGREVKGKSAESNTFFEKQSIPALGGNKSTT